MVVTHAAIALELIALTSGAFLLLKTYQEGLVNKKCLKGIAYFVMIVSTLTLLCSTWALFFNQPEPIALEQQSQVHVAPRAHVQPATFANPGTNQIVLQRNRLVRQQQEDARDHR